MSHTVCENNNDKHLSCGDGDINGDSEILKSYDTDQDITNSSIMEFLNQEQQCIDGLDIENCSEVDIDSIFEEIHRLSGGGDSDRSVEEILKEAEMLMSRQDFGQLENITPRNRNIPIVVKDAHSSSKSCNGINYIKPISLESTPREMKYGGDLDKLDLPEVHEITSSIANIDINKNYNNITDIEICTNKSDSESNGSIKSRNRMNTINRSRSVTTLINEDNVNNNKLINTNCNGYNYPKQKSIKKCDVIKASPNNRNIFGEKRKFLNGTSNELKSVDNMLNETFTQNLSKCKKSFSDKSTSPPPTPTPPPTQSFQSPTHSLQSSTSFSCTRERTLENEVELLQEKLKDTEERLQSLKIQHDSLSQIHRILRENNNQIQEESDRLKIDVQHLTDCSTVLRSELQSARIDRNDAVEIQKILQKELDESRDEKKKVQDQFDKDAKTIQDLHRQCKEMERILMRKHPDSVSALIVASKNPSNSSIQDNSSCRRLLEQRIAQLESDAKEQDQKAQKILTNVQSRFSSVQSKYETHISDLETQVLSLQQINAQLNENIECQSESLRNYRKRNHESTITNYTQTIDLPERDIINTCTTGTQTELKVTVVTKQLPNKKVKPLDNNKDDAHLLSTIRGMRVDLAIKEKALQRLTRELDECKKTIKKLQKEKEALKCEKSNSATSVKKLSDSSLSGEINSDGNTLQDTLRKMKLLECDYKVLHEKRLQDLKTLQSAHERELTISNETVRILQQQLAERDEAFAMQKRRNVPIDYFALKAKVSSLERRHTEREQRLHMLVEALSRGQLNGTLDDLNQNKNCH